MNSLPIQNHEHINNTSIAGVSTKRIFLCLTLLACILLSSCTAIKEATSRAGQKKTNKNTQAQISLSDQMVPVIGKVISPFGFRGHHRHTGADIKLQRGDTVRAAFCGEVLMAAPYFGYGNLVILKHQNNIETYYAHLSKCLVHKGDSIVVGQPVGLGGRTGRATTDHLHFEVRCNKVPSNPEKFFNFSTGEVKTAFMAYSPVIKTINIQQIESNPSDDFVVIKKGDTLYSLAKQYNSTVEKLQLLNNLKDTYINIGMKLKVK